MLKKCIYNMCNKKLMLKGILYSNRTLKIKMDANKILLQKVHNHRLNDVTLFNIEKVV